MQSGGQEVGQEREEQGDEDEEKVVDAKHLRKGCLVNHLIPSPPKSNHLPANRQVIENLCVCVPAYSMYVSVCVCVWQLKS